MNEKLLKLISHGKRLNMKFIEDGVMFSECSLCCVVWTFGVT